jgi:pyruvate kinase
VPRTATIVHLLWIVAPFLTESMLLCVQTAEDVKFIRSVLDKNGGERIKIISKIENTEGLKNFDEILKATDGVMVARGDLGMEIPSEKVGILLLLLLSLHIP